MSAGTKLFYQVGKVHLTQCMKLCTTPTCVHWMHSNSSLGTTNPLLDGPDFTYVDGRPTPLTLGQKRRIIAQKEAIETAFRCIDDIDATIRRFEDKKRAAEEEREHTISSRFREKGEPLDE